MATVSEAGAAPARAKVSEPLLLVIAPAALLGLVGMVMVTSTMTRLGTLSFGDPLHFALRQAAALVLAAFAALAVARSGARRMLDAAPAVFVAVLLLALAVFVPGLGVRAAGAHRWLRLGPLSFAPAPLVILAVALLLSSWGRPRPRPAGATRAEEAEGQLWRLRRRRALALALAGGAMLALVAEPDFSAAAVAGLVAVTALAGLGLGGRRLLPASILFALGLAIVASRFGYVGGRVAGFLAPERDRAGAGYEVLALERAASVATPVGVGLGQGEARRRLSSPGTDYVFAVILEEGGFVSGLAVGSLWLCIAAGAVVAARRRSDRRLRALALASGAALVAPAALHVAVCVGIVPIIGVAMPLVSYDPGAALAAGAEIGLLASVMTSEPT